MTRMESVQKQKLINISLYMYIYIFLISQPVRDRLPAFTIYYEVNADGAAQRLENSDTGAG